MDQIDKLILRAFGEESAKSTCFLHIYLAQVCFMPEHLNFQFLLTLLAVTSKLCVDTRL